MSALDISPPAAPAMDEQQPRAGFFNRLFKNKKQESEERPTLQDELASFEPGNDEFDLNDIKRKMGIEGEGDTPADQMAETAPFAADDRELPDERGNETEHAVPPSPARMAPPPEAPIEMEPLDTPPAHHETDAPAETGEPAPAIDDVGDWAVDASNEKLSSDTSDWAEHPEPSVNEALSDLPSDWAEHSEEKSRPATRMAEESDWTSKPDNEREREMPSEKTGEFADDMPPSFDEESSAETSAETSTEFSTESAIEPETEEREMEAPEEGPIEPLEFDVSETHFPEIEAEHKELDEQLREILEPEEPMPVADHPLDRPAEQGKEFVLKNGQSLKTLRDLMSALNVIDDETFAHHVTEDRNDFANWLQHVLEEELLADQIRNGKAKQELLALLKAHEQQLDNRFREEENKIEDLLEKRKQKLERVGAVDTKLESLKQALNEKHVSLGTQQAILTEDVEKRLNEELEKRLKERRTELVKKEREAERTRKEYEKKLEVMARAFEKKYEMREKKLLDKEERLEKRQESLKNLELTLKEGKKELEQQKREAKGTLDEAAAAKKEIEDLEKRGERLAVDQVKLKEEQETFTAEKKAINAKKASLASQESRIKNDREKLNKREQEVTKQEGLFKKDSEELKKGKADFDKAKKDFTAHEKKTLAKIEAEQKKAEERIKKAEEAEARVEEKLKERRKIQEYIEESERKIDDHYKKIEKEDLHGYMEKRLQDIGDERIPEAPPAETLRNLKIYTMIDRARQALEQANVKEARHLYNQIREGFNKERLTPNEKSVLYNTIRELYDDIHLASLK